MNISGSLSIKTATVGGAASGSYVDSDKFKDADINFQLTVKVVNQVVQPSEYSIFNKLDKVTPQNFAELYGVSLACLMAIHRANLVLGHIYLWLGDWRRVECYNIRESSR